MVGTSPLKVAKWIGLHEVTFIDGAGTERKWEMIERTTRRPEAPVDGVDMLAIIRTEGREDRLILVKQFRPPMAGFTLEFPAGLLDPKESLEECACRELREETGYVATVTGVGPAVCMDPGTSNCATAIVRMQVDGKDPRNISPKANNAHDEGEFIEVVTLPLRGLLVQLNSMVEKTPNLTIDSRVFTFALGLDHMNFVNSPL